MPRQGWPGQRARMRPWQRRRVTGTVLMQGELAGQAEWEYAPAPESRDIVTIAPEYGLFIDGEFGPAADGRHVRDRQPGHRGAAGPGGRGRARRRRRAPSPPPARPSSRSGARCRAAERAKYLFRIARHAARAVARVRRAGDPRQRQADPRVARRRHPAGRGALLLLRRLGRQARVRRLRPVTRAARRRRPGHPLELPAADGRLEAGARRSPPATPACSSRPRPPRSPRCCSPRSASRPSCRPASSTSLTGDGRDRRRAGAAPGRGQGRLHRLDRGRQGDRRARSPAPASG